MPNAWEQRDDETGQAFDAFVAYRSIPQVERSIRRAAEQVGKNPRLLERWSATHDWLLRVRAWDRHLADVEAAELEAERRRAVRQKVKLAGRVIDVSSAALAAVVRTLQPFIDGTADEAMSPGQAVALLRVIATAGANADRMLGEPQRVELSGPEGGPVEVAATPMSDADRLAIMAALAESGALEAIPSTGPDDDGD